MSDEDWVTYGIMAHEVGEQGTPHIQGSVCFKNSKRLTQLKAMLDNVVHWEVKKGICREASDYWKQKE